MARAFFVTAPVMREEQAMQEDAGIGRGQTDGRSADAAPLSDGSDVRPVRHAARRSARRAPDPVETARRQLLRAVQRQVRMIDKRLSGDGAEVEERDSRILANLAKTLVTLLEIGAGGTGTKDKELTDRGDAEARLAERVSAWARGGS
jgi:hypothetical protein